MILITVAQICEVQYPQGPELIEQFRNSDSAEDFDYRPRAKPGETIIEATRKDDFIEGSELGDYAKAQAGDDYISGGSGRDYFYGGRGDDILDGGDDDDTLMGGAGSDVISGGSGDDAITGLGRFELFDEMSKIGFNLDTLYGGPGADSFFLIHYQNTYVSYPGRAIIMDFNPEEGDRLGIDHDVPFESIVFRFDGQLTEVVDMTGPFDNVVATLQSPAGKGKESDFTPYLNIESNKESVLEHTNGTG